MSAGIFFGSISEVCSATAISGTFSVILEAPAAPYDPKDGPSAARCNVARSPSESESKSESKASKATTRRCSAPAARPCNSLRHTTKTVNLLILDGCTVKKMTKTS